MKLYAYESPIELSSMRFSMLLKTEYILGLVDRGLDTLWMGSFLRVIQVDAPEDLISSAYRA